MLYDKIYTLMSQDHPIFDISYNSRKQDFIQIFNKQETQYAPPGVLDSQQKISLSEFLTWWQNRAIPASRKQIKNVLQALHLPNTLALVEKNFGLSLSDCYWLKDKDLPLQWKDINFFDNEFSEDLGELLVDQSDLNDVNLLSPSGTLNGNLRKKWIIEQNTRVLIKESNDQIGQTAYNEIVATKLYESILQPDDYVPYALFTDKHAVYTACPNFLKNDQEFIPAADLIRTHPKRYTKGPEGINAILRTLKQTGTPDFDIQLSKMFVCDYILANTDRHAYNFGCIRNVKTLSYEAFAPLFDSGNSLWFNCPLNAEETPYNSHFLRRNGVSSKGTLELVSHWDWLDTAKLNTFPDTATHILSKCEVVSPQKLENIQQRLTQNIKTVKQQQNSRRQRIILQNKFPHPTEENQELIQAAFANDLITTPIKKQPNLVDKQIGDTHVLVQAYPANTWSQLLTKANQSGDLPVIHAVTIEKHHTTTIDVKTINTPELPFSKKEHVRNTKEAKQKNTNILPSLTPIEIPTQKTKSHTPER